LRPSNRNTPYGATVAWGYRPDRAIAVYSCSGCRGLISLSIIPGGNPATKTGTMWVRTWQQCRACELLWCDDCTNDAPGVCPGCAGELWTPDAEGRMRLMFPPLPSVPSAPDAATRTWSEDLRLAVEAGLPVLSGVALRDGLPDLRDGATVQKYLRWLCVLCHLTKADRVIAERISVELDDRYQEVSISMRNFSVALGGVDPYGPRSMNMTGRWADPSDADLMALALRCAWDDFGVTMSPHMAAELAKLDQLLSPATAR
jgi:hypothetical protein